MSALNPCVICGGAFRTKLVTPGKGLEVPACQTCGLWILRQPPSPARRHGIYDKHYYDSWGVSPDTLETVSRMKRKTFEWAFTRIEQHAAPGRLLDVGCAFGACLEVGQARGWDVYGLEVNPFAAELARKRFGSRIMVGDVESAQLEAASFHAVLMWDTLEHLTNPRRALERMNRLLRSDGLLVLNTPSTRSLSAKLLRGFWPHLKAEHLYYLSPKNLTRLLDETGFRCLTLTPGIKALNLQYVHDIMTHYPVAGLSSCVRFIHALAPRRVKTLNLYVKFGDMFVIARKGTDATPSVAPTAKPV